MGRGGPLLPRQYIHGDGGDPALPPRRLDHEASPWVAEGGHHGRVGRGRAGYCVSLPGIEGSQRPSIALNPYPSLAATAPAGHSQVLGQGSTVPVPGWG